jgi:hypothetical protein
MTDDAVATLRLFNEKVERLDRLSFTQYLRTNGLGIFFSARIGEPVTMSVHMPNEEATDAFVLTLRYFLQDNESISIRQMAKLYQSMPVSQNLKDRYAGLRDRINTALDSRSPIDFEGEGLTHRDVLYVFLYGGLAHANRDKKAQFDEWGKNELLFAAMQMIFNRAILGLLQFLVSAHLANMQAIAELEGHARQDLPPW